MDFYRWEFIFSSFCFYQRKEEFIMKNVLSNKWFKLVVAVVSFVLVYKNAFGLVWAIGGLSLGIMPAFYISWLLVFIYAIVAIVWVIKGFKKGKK